MATENQFRKDLRSLQTKMTNPKSSDNYHELRDKILTFMKATQRTWGNALMYLLKLGLDAEKKNQELINNNK